MPGPKEQTPDQVQRFMRPFVNELLRLWVEGFLIMMPEFPLGLLVRVILICVICDKPAAHKLGGFGSHSHTFFCTRCWIKQSEKGTAAAFQQNGMSILSSLFIMCIDRLYHDSIPSTYPCRASASCT